MNTFKPEIQELLKAVEKKYSQNLRTTTDFDVFSLHLKLQLDVSISTSTLKRLWGYVKDKHKPRNQTLDSLATIHRLFQLQRVLRLPERQQFVQFILLCHETDSNQKSLGRRRN